MGAFKAQKPSDRLTGNSYKPFIRKKQLRGLLLVSFSRWLLTAALLISIYVVLEVYSSKEAMTQRKKHEFNALIVALPIALSLNIASALKAMAAELRWWVLSLRNWNATEADLILQSENLTHVIRLGFITRLFSVRLCIVIWLAINIASQAVIATLGLTYSVGAANHVTVRRPGTVSIPDLSSIQTNKVIRSASQTETLSALRYTANSYGLIALAYNWATVKSIPEPGTLRNTDSPLIFCDLSHATCEYVFYESTPDDARHYLTVATNRSVATGATCNSWRVIVGGNGTESSITIADDPERTVIIPAVNGDDQTTFVVETNDSEAASSLVSAFEASATDPWYYECNVTVKPVTHGWLPVHQLGENITALAAPAIALQGYGASQLGSQNNSKQFQSYPAEVAYGSPQGGNATDMALLMSAFSIGVITVTAESNSYINAAGLLPLKGVNLDVPHWSNVYIILGLIAGFQLFLGLLSALVANSVMVRSHSFLGMAWLLKPVLQRMSYRAVTSGSSSKWPVFEPETTLTYCPAGYGNEIYHIKTN